MLPTANGLAKKQNTGHVGLGGETLQLRLANEARYEPCPFGKKCLWWSVASRTGTAAGWHGWYCNERSGEKRSCPPFHVRVARAQDVLGLHRSAIYRWDSAGLLTIHKRGNCSFLRVAEMESLIEGGKSLGDHLGGRAKGRQSKPPIFYNLSR